MSDLNDKAYYRRRAAEARALADKATDPHIRAIHAEMARNYELLADDAPAARATLRFATD